LNPCSKKALSNSTLKLRGRKPRSTPKKWINSAETTIHNQQFSAEGGAGAEDFRKVLASVSGKDNPHSPRDQGIGGTLFRDTDDETSRRSWGTHPAPLIPFGNESI